MTNYKLHEDCKKLSWAVYQDEKPKNINVWQYKKSIQDSNGFYAEVYERDNNIILALRGTDFNYGVKELIRDVDDDLQISTMNLLPSQLKNARMLYNEYARLYPNAHIILTGHSLGGSVVQALGAETGAETITFGAYGIANTHSPSFKYTKNITNYGNSQDAVFVSNIDFQLGKTIVLSNSAKKENSFKTSIQKPQKSPHLLENYGDLSKGVEYKKEEFDSTDTPLFKTCVEYFDYDDSVFDVNNRVLYDGEINPSELDKNSPLYDLYMDQWIDKRSMPTKAEVDKRTRIGELIYVKEYTRSDGTKVSGYYRTCPK